MLNSSVIRYSLYINLKAVQLQLTRQKLTVTKKLDKKKSKGHRSKLLRVWDTGIACLYINFDLQKYHSDQHRFTIARCAGSWRPDGRWGGPAGSRRPILSGRGPGPAGSRCRRGRWRGTEGSASTALRGRCSGTRCPPRAAGRPGP